VCSGGTRAKDERVMLMRVRADDHARCTNHARARDAAQMMPPMLMPQPCCQIREASLMMSICRYAFIDITSGDTLDAVHTRALKDVMMIADEILTSNASPMPPLRHDSDDTPLLRYHVDRLRSLLFTVTWLITFFADACHFVTRLLISRSSMHKI